MTNVITRVSNAAGQFTVYPSAVRTAAPADTMEYEVAGYRGLVLVIDATAVTATPALTVSILGVDRASGKTYLILASTAIATAVTTTLRVTPHMAAVNNLVANDVLPPIIRISAAHGDSDSITYSIGASLTS